MGVENGLLLDGRVVGKGEVYKRSGAMSRFVRISAIALVVVVTGVLVYLHWEPASQEPGVISVQVEEGSVRVSNGAGEVELAAGDRSVIEPGRAPTLIAAAQPTPEEHPSPAPAPTLPEMPSEPVLAVRLVDALGEPIPNGVIEIASQTYESAWSEFTIHNVTEGTHTLLAHADGYFSATETVDVPADEWKTVTLEYACGFEIEVRDKPEGGGPVEGAEVLLYEGPPVPRPVRNSLTFVHKWNERDNRVVEKATLRRDGGQIRVVQADGRVTQGGLCSGDVVTGFASLSQGSDGLPEAPSQLRLWDCLAALCSYNDEPVHLGSLTIRRDVRSFSTTFNSKGPSIEGGLVATSITDENGKCWFENLPPCIYYAEGRKGKARSEIYTISPVDRSVGIWLPEEQNSVVTVTVMDPIGGALLVFGDAEVELRGLDSFVLLSGKTRFDILHEEGGQVTFHSVPFGKYQLTATLANVEHRTLINTFLRHAAALGHRYKETDFVPPSKQMAISVERPQTSVVVRFEPESGFKVSGIVRRAGSKERIAGYPLKLCFFSRDPQSEPVYATESDSQGRFEFTRVVPGDYILAGYSVRERDTGYMFSWYGVRLWDPDGPRPRPEPRIRVIDEDVEGIEYTVLPTVRTRLMGRVVATDGRPVVNAALTLEHLDEQVFESGNRIDVDGRFVMSMLLPARDKIFETTLHAWAFEPLPNERNDISAAGQGSTPVAFSSGDTIQGIRIVVDLADKGHVLTGRITAPDGRIPERIRDIRVSAKQEGLPISPLAWVQSDGSYHVERLLPGPFTLNIWSGTPLETPENVILPPPFSPVRSTDIPLEMPPDRESITYDVVLKQNSYFHGRVIYADQRPVSDADLSIVQATWVGVGPADYNFDNYYTVRLNSAGYFLLHVLPGRQYTLRAIVHTDRKWYEAQLENLEPPIENIVLQVKARE